MRGRSRSTRVCALTCAAAKRGSVVEAASAHVKIISTGARAYAEALHANGQSEPGTGEIEPKRSGGDAFSNSINRHASTG